MRLPPATTTPTRATTRPRAWPRLSRPQPAIPRTFAPGTGITSAWNTADDAIAALSGTSMASPHVAGVAALYLQSHPAASANEVAAAVLGSATPDKIADAAGSPNRL